MCSGGPKMPKAPTPPPPAPMPPPPAPLIEPEAPTPAPTTATQETDAAKIKKRTTKRRQQQQASRGANALRIPLNTGARGGGGKKTGSLNIPS